MMRTVKARLLVVLAVVATLLALATGGATAQERGKAGVTGGRGDAGEPLEAMIEAYQRAYPRISDEAAKTAAEQQEERKAIYDKVLAEREEAFGGAWFDPPKGVLHIAVTEREVGHEAARLGEELGRGEGRLGELARGQVGLSVEDNTVVVAVPERLVPQATELAKEAGVRVVADPQLKVEADAGCTSRAACDWTVRAGARLWRTWQGNDVCSVGFTADNASNRYTYTAGHCSNGNNVTWGTGAKSIGPMQSSIDWWAYDAAIIRVTNSWFAYDLGGELYHEWTAGKSLPVKGYAPTWSYIWSGDTVCLAANYTQVNGPNYCGVVTDTSDSGVRGMVKVSGFDACGGDSGGGWYWLTSSGNRIAFGLHSRSSTGCHGSNGGSTSWFSPVPLANNLWGLRVETR